MYCIRIGRPKAVFCERIFENHVILLFFYICEESKKKKIYNKIKEKRTRL